MKFVVEGVLIATGEKKYLSENGWIYREKPAMEFSTLAAANACASTKAKNPSVARYYRDIRGKEKTA